MSTQVIQSANDLDIPGSLRRRGPALIEVLEESGDAAPLLRKGFVLHSGKRYLIRVRLQPPDGFGCVKDVTVSTSECFRTIVPIVRVEKRSLVEYEVTVRARHVHTLPMANLTVVAINLVHSSWGVLSIRVSMVIRPTFWNQLAQCWGWLAGSTIVVTLSQWLFSNRAMLEWLADPFVWTLILGTVALLIGFLRVASRFTMPFVGPDEP